MNVFYGIEAVPDHVKGGVLTIGNFDGVHRGHQQIIAQASLFADQTKGAVTALTFDPHPLSVVSPGNAPARLMPVEEKVRQLGRVGANVVIVLNSEPHLLSLSASDFIKKIIVQKFAPTHVVEGDSFGFGQGREGTTELLRTMGRESGFEMFVVEPVRMQIETGETVLVSSSLVRRFIQDGAIHRAQICLGRPYSLFGVVEKGAGRGKSLGFPTANLGQIEQLLPLDGVYAGEADICGERYTAGISIGKTPTFGGDRRQIEAFLLDCDRPLLSQPMQLAFWRRLRDQKKYNDAQSLVEQIRADIYEVQTIASREKEIQEKR